MGKPSKRTSRVDLGDIEPVIIDDEDDEEEEVEKVHLFTLNGVEYWVPVKAAFNVALKSLRVFGKKGEAAAVDYQMEALLGAEAYEALLDYPKLKRKHLELIMEKVNEIVLAAEEGKAESPADSARSAGSRSASATSSRTRTRSTTSTSGR